MEKTVTITVEEYEQLKHDSNFLACLEAMGVDNWQGYDDACEYFEEEWEEYQ